MKGWILIRGVQFNMEGWILKGGLGLIWIQSIGTTLSSKSIALIHGCRIFLHQVWKLHLSILVYTGGIGSHL
jgi:hypothetical protein